VVAPARYDDVADFYEAGWADASGDAVLDCLFDLLGAVRGLRILDAACGHGRVTRELARRGAQVTGVDLSAALIDKALAQEAREPLSVTYFQGDIGATAVAFDGRFDAVICSFGLSDIDDLDAAIAAVAGALRPAGVFAFCLLHPCFPGDGPISGSWPSTGTYYDEGWWLPQGHASSLRRKVGANHRTLATYLNAMTAHGLLLDRLAEPPPPKTWRDSGMTAATFPVFLAGRCSKQPSEA
jgi:2-polyprenyl-3-methyl-5-hydroxy-6-metoxy-1,4-benzoquinol methylase